MTELVPFLRKQSEEVAAELKKYDCAGKTVTVKVKFFDFRTITRSRSLKDCTRDPDVIFSVARDLLEHTEAEKIPVRLLGVTVSNFPVPQKDESDPGQMIQPEFDFGEEEL